MSKDKYSSIFSPQMKAIVFTILQIFYATRAVLKLGNIIISAWRCNSDSRANALPESLGTGNATTLSSPLCYSSKATSFLVV